MKKKKWILPGLVAFLVVAGSVTVGFSSKSSSVQKQENKNNSTCCQKMKECENKDGGGSGEMMLDNLSRQFMTIFPAGY
ncbi:MAG: hypothetical protein HOP10_03380 [Chitinophagaceae bacterium]|nr:hypothetical protein [Chitinophagaceae bacterium]